MPWKCVSYLFRARRLSSQRWRFQDCRRIVLCLRVFYESVHRIMDLIVAMTRVFEGERPVTLARELTKTFETVYHTHLSHLKMWLEQHPQQRRGEFVIVLAGAPFQDVTLAVEHQRVLEILLKELSLKQAVALSARLTGVSRKVLYTAALKFSPR